MNSFELVVAIFASFVIGSVLTFVVFKRKKQSCAYCDDSWDKLKKTWTGYFQLFTVIKNMFDDNIKYEDIKETVIMTYELISKGEEKFYNE